MQLPGTCKIKSTSGSEAYGKIYYGISIEVVHPGFFEIYFHHSQEVLICQALSSEMAKIDSYREAKVTFLCFIPKGTVALEANLNKNAYGRAKSLLSF